MTREPSRHSPSTSQRQARRPGMTTRSMVTPMSKRSWTGRHSMIPLPITLTPLGWTAAWSACFFQASACGDLQATPISQRTAKFASRTLHSRTHPLIPLPALLLPLHIRHNPLHRLQNPIPPPQKTNLPILMLNSTLSTKASQTPNFLRRLIFILLLHPRKRVSVNLAAVFLEFA
jgi:hypothetical protein